MIEITRKIEFDAGHRVLNHEGKCRNLHGHRYVAEISVTAPELDALGRVIDFSQIKAKVGTWVDEYWDHNLILHPDDPLLKRSDAAFLVGREPYVMPRGLPNPTAENLSAQLGATADLLLNPFGMQVTQIKLFETPNCWAIWTPE